jgi:hypothetical protein
MEIIKPQNFYKIARIMRDFNKEDRELSLSIIADDTHKIATEISDEYGRLLRANSNIMQEIRNATKSNPFMSIEQQEADFGSFIPEIQGSSFIRVVLKVFEQLDVTWNGLLSLVENIKPDELYVSDYNRHPLVSDTNQRHMQLMELELNMPSASLFVNNIITVADLQSQLYSDVGNVVKVIEQYYEFIHHRHNVDGVKIFRDPIITDIAITIFENIDAHGEIIGGKNPEEISSYTEGKALALASAIKSGKIRLLIEKPENFQEFIQKNIGSLRGTAIDIQNTLKNVTHDVCLAVNHKSQGHIKDADWANLIQRVQDSNAASIKDTSDEKLLSPSEKFANKFKNETIDNIVKILSDNTTTVKDLVKYVLKRKYEMRQYNQTENSFYTCRISAGNPFLGQAPGALEVIPAEKPSAKLEHILGSGFDEVRSFIKGIDGAIKWHDLFLATSPRQKIDRQHLLLVAPQGTGKTQVMRAVANCKGSVSIFAQGSDFLTCWKGEDLKNPKRLFQQALKIQKDTKKHVYIMIDEVDAVLNNDRGPTDTNLNLEFQILMDGMISYPHISVWGATNALERIPMPMIRRFKVLIVGELNKQDREDLLKYYVGFLPYDISDKDFSLAADKLEGATGDIIAKIAESIWREKLTQFTIEDEKAATELTDFLNENEQFNIRDFDDKTRHNFLQKLKKYVLINAKDLDNAIGFALGSIGVRSEIEMAVLTYNAARKFIASLENKKV